MRRYTCSIASETAGTANLLDLDAEPGAVMVACGLDRDIAQTLAAQLNALAGAERGLRDLAATIDDADPLHDVLDAFDAWADELRGRPARLAAAGELQAARDV